MGKLYKHLAKISLVSSFGRNSSKPLRKVVFSMTAGCILALIGGYFAAHAIQGSSFARGTPNLIAYALMISVIFGLTGFVLMPITQVFAGQQFSVSRKLTVLPLLRRQRWFVIILPVVLITILITIFAVPVLFALSMAMATNKLLVLFAFFTGLITSICYVVTVLPQRIIAKNVLFVGVCAGQMFLLEYIFDATSQFQTSLALAGIFTVQVIFCFYAAMRYMKGVITPNTIGRSVVRLKIPAKIIGLFWFSLKQLRNRKTLASLCFCLVISGSIAGFNLFRHQTLIEPSMLIVVGALLVSSYATDLRTLVSRYKAPEIFDLLGANFFINSEIKSLFLAALTIMAPIVPIVIFSTHTNLPALLGYTFSLVTGGGFLGLMYGTVFLPESGEIGMQFFTGMAAAISLLLLPKILRFSNLNLMLKSIAWLCVAGVCLLIIMLTEDIRKRGYGHVK